MAAAADVLIRSLALGPSSGAEPSVNISQAAAASGFDAAALRLESIHLLLLILQVPLDEVST